MASGASGCLVNQLAQLLAYLAGLRVRLLDQVACGDRESIFDGDEGRLDAADDLLYSLIDVLHPLGDLAADISEVALNLGAGLDEPFLELLAPDLRRAGTRERRGRPPRRRRPWRSW